jgi:hypothetical protein
VKNPDPVRKYESKEGEKTCASWLLRHVVETVVLAALAVRGLRALGAMRVEWAKPYDVLGRFVLNSYPAAPATPADASNPG